ncbi:MAG: glycoside hydrolase family 1 protein [Kofleriaceae bacterium]
MAKATHYRSAIWIVNAAVPAEDVRVKTAIAVVVLLAACGDDPPPTISYGAMGSLTQPSGEGSFRFGAATAATQIEDMNPATDWYLWTQPVAEGGMGKGTFVGDAVKGYSMVDDDLALVTSLGLDSYRFSIEWARIEPVKDQIDEAAIAHYRTQLETMKAMGMRPLVTLHHFSNPVWVMDPREAACPAGPTATNLCGFGGPGGAMIVDEMGAHAALMAQRFGDLVDEWGTVNEPFIYMLAAYGIGNFPPGKNTILNLPEFLPAVRDYVAAHAAMYKAIKANDTVDADGDGNPADVGLSMSVASWQPARGNKPSTNADDIAAAERITYIMHYLFVDAALNGTFDGNVDGDPEEQHPEWANTIDWLGLQYYFRAGVSADRPLIPAPASLTPCIGGFDVGSCLPALDPTYCVPTMGYEGYAQGIEKIITDHAARYPGLPLVVSEAGIATSTGKRRAENVVRVLEAMERARADGADLRGYYHWSLTDNFEWAEGYVPKFGLYAVDRSTFARTETEGATALRDIATARALTTAQREDYGGEGPMTPDPQFTDDFCTKPSPE